MRCAQACAASLGRALREGCTPAEVLDALLMAFPILGLAKTEGMLFKFGSGTGTDLSSIRSHREKLSGGGRPSGPLSFMRVYDQIAAVLAAAGAHR